MTQSVHTPCRTHGNRLLDMMSEADADRVLKRSERVHQPLRTIVAEMGEAPPFAIFPLTSVVSVTIPLHDGSAIEAGSIGNEGMSGIDLQTRRPLCVYRGIIQIDGEALRVPAGDFRRMLAESDDLAELVKLYTLTIIHQAGQSAACNLRHNIEERMARWLLMTHDRVGQDEFYLTQEFLGVMLGIRRQSVSLTAATLHEAGMIRYNRGSMKILDREGLERVSCECYRTVREVYKQVMLPAGGR